MNNPFSQDRLKDIKVQKTNNLFPIDWSYVDRGICGGCGRKLKKTLKGDRYCGRCKIFIKNL